MTVLNKTMGRILLVIAAVAAIVGAFVFTPGSIDNIVGIAAAGNGQALVQRIADDEIIFELISSSGNTVDSFSISQTSGDEKSKILDFSIDAEGIVCLIREYSDKYTGEYIRQDLEVYDMNSLFSKRVAEISLENEDGIHYKWVSTSGVTVLMGTDALESTLVRTAYDTESLINVANPQTKSYREYEVDPEEGIYDVVVASDGVAFATMSGKVFAAEDGGEAEEIYPARELTELMYPMFIEAFDSEKVLIGEQISGDVLSLSVGSGDTEMLMSNSTKFTGINDYSSGDLLLASFADTQNYAGVVKSINTDGYAVVISEDGIASSVEKITKGIIPFVAGVIINFLIYAVVLIGAVMFVTIIISQVRASRTVLLKLIFASIPMVVIAFIAFGAFSYNSYSNSIEENFNKQVEDEGNLLTALFGADGFSSIEYPYHYNSVDYRYIARQLATREVYTRTAYYENNELHIGVDTDNPCFYPLELVGSSDLMKLYSDAVFSGNSQTGVIEDEDGKRITCVTPIGGASGSTVYLLETGILSSNMDRYNNAFIGQFVMIAAVFIVVICAMLIYSFRRVLTPLAEIKNGLEEFSVGNRKIRLETETEDELSDITKVFNKMATDIDTQLYSLKSLSNTYYRFVPQRIFKLLGKERLSDIKLGDYTQGRYNVLYVRLRLNSDKLSPKEDRAISDRYFNIVNQVCNQFDATMLVDRMDMHDLKIICGESGNTGVNIALAALALVDGYNATCLLQNRMEVVFVLHHTDLLYSISGDENRFIPTMVSSGLRNLEKEMDNLRMFSARLIVTEDAYKTLESDKYYHRHIGTTEGEGIPNTPLYDFYDSSSPEVIRLINGTKNTFDKAMELYSQGRYYDSKNLFALVIRENHYDNVARSYIFRCEKKLNQ